MLPSSTVYVPNFKTKPRSPEVTLGVVIGNNGIDDEKNTIHTDEHGRVKVRINAFSSQETVDNCFNPSGINLSDTKDYSHSAYLRVMTPIASSDSGFFAIPRIGDEVVVSFLEGDIDKPMVSASLYNAYNPQLPNLPSDYHQTTLSSKTIGVNESGRNEFTFSNLKDKEHIYLKAQKDYGELIQHDFTQTILNDKSSKVLGTYTERIQEAHVQTIDLAKNVNVGAEYLTTVGLSKDTVVGLSNTVNVGVDNKIRVGQDSSEYVGNDKNIEIKVARVLANMEFEGIHVSKKALDEMSQEFDERIKVLEGSIYTLAGSEFNIASPKQLGVVLFEDLGLPVVKKTKTGYSTAVEVLEQLQYKHDIIPLIMEYRTLTKLNSTYAKGLVKDITREGKIHTRYEQTLTQTGRLSSVNPNLQNIPTRIEEGKKIRKAFIPASSDRVILSIDYSQIELRVLAHIAQDKGMIDAFKHDVDIHTKTASDVNGVPLDEVTPTMRREAKAVNFGIVYGISDFGLSNNLGITRKRAKEFIEKYLETFKGVDKYMTDIVEFAKEHGYVETLYNRRRSLPEINAKNKIIANLNARIAMNTPIQGTAADIIKIAMISAYNYIEESKVDAKLLLQVHDELIFDVSKDILEEFTDKMVTIMEEAANLDVKLKAEASSGPSWYEAK